MKILVTGGAGFLGSHLCDRLLDQGNEVICMDNFYTGSKKNIESHLGNPNFELIEHDVIDPFKLNVEQIYNLACPASPDKYQYDPLKTMKTSIFGSFNALELSRFNGAKILQSSTSEVYGDPSIHPQNEQYRGSVNTIGPRACYDEGKRCAETLFFDYHREFNLDIKVVRIFNTYGPRMSNSDGRVVSNFLTQAMKGKDITVFGDGSQTRSFCYVDDLIEGILKMMNSHNFKGPVNLGNNNEFSILELAKTVKEITGSKSKIIYKNLPVDDPLQRCPDLKLAKQKLKWEPSVQLKEGLIKTLKYYKKII